MFSAVNIFVVYSKYLIIFLRCSYPDYDFGTALKSSENVTFEKYIKIINLATRD